MRARNGAWLLLFAAGALLVGGCGGNDDDNDSRKTTSTSSGGGGKPTQTVEISLTEYKLDPAEVSVNTSGLVEFKVTNDGTTKHALEIEGNGVEEKTDELAPGESDTLDVELKNGLYDLYCPVDGHRAHGMEGSVTVGDVAGGGEGEPGAASTAEDEDKTTTTDTTEDESGDDSGGSNSGSGGGSGY